MPVYIQSTSAISAQNTFDEAHYLEENIETDKGYLVATEPKYKPFIPPMLARRMSRVIKMSIATAKTCMAEKEAAELDAIIVGTGLGCIDDTEKFLSSLIEQNEGLLSPTSFIQSTHNTIAGQIALLLKCPSYNFTYVQRGHSFENALHDAKLQIEEEGSKQILVGGVDEITPTIHAILEEIACTGNKNSTKGRTLFGEGASFFLLTNQERGTAIAKIDDLETYYDASGIPSMNNHIEAFLEKNKINLDDIDAVMLGYNGYAEEDKIYQTIQERIFPKHLIVKFKHISGEYFTASAFGLHLATNMLQKQKVYDNCIVSGKPSASLNKILIYNHFQKKNHSIILVSRCQNTSL